MSALVSILNRRKNYAVLATDSRVTLMEGDEFAGTFDGATKLRDAGHGAVYVTTETFGYKMPDNLRCVLTRPLRGVTLQEKAEGLHREMKVQGAEKITAVLAGFEGAPALYVVTPGSVGSWSYGSSACVSMGLDAYIPRLWNRVYVKEGADYREMNPVALDTDDMSVSKAVDAVLFLLQSGAKYLELCSGDYASPWGRPTVGGAIDLVVITPGNLNRFRVGGGYGFDTDYMKLSETFNG